MFIITSAVKFPIHLAIDLATPDIVTNPWCRTKNLPSLLSLMCRRFALLLVLLMLSLDIFWDKDGASANWLLLISLLHFLVLVNLNYLNL